MKPDCTILTLVLSLTSTIAAANPHQGLSSGVALHPIPAPPSVGHLDSTTFPIRVHYEADSSIPFATALLTAAEQAWQQEIVEAGFTAPLTQDDNLATITGTNIYLKANSFSGRTTQIADVPSTATCDCSTYITIGRSLSEAEAASQIVHELHHASQAATDCGEAASAFESFAATVETVLNPEWYGLSFEQKAFQNKPEYSLDFFVPYNGSNEQEAAYGYGAALFPLFVNDRFGAGDLKLIAQLWKSFAQDGTFNTLTRTCSNGNHPDWFEATETVLQTQGSSFDEAFDEFGVWRSITGEHDDGHHYQQGAQFAPVQEAATHDLSTLPITGTFAVREYGSRHIAISPNGFDQPIRLRVQIDTTATWGASVLLWRQGEEVERRVLSFQGADGQVEVQTLAGVSRAMLVVSHHRDATHDPDEMEYDTERSFSYTIESNIVVDAGADVPLESAPEASAEAGEQPQAEPVPEAGPSQRDVATDTADPVDPTSPAPVQNADSDGCGCRTQSGQGQSKWMIGTISIAAAWLLAKRRKPTS